MNRYSVAVDAVSPKGEPAPDTAEVSAVTKPEALSKVFDVLHDAGYRVYALSRPQYLSEA